jgi:hypothetical protein
MSTATLETGKVKGRRELHFNSIDEISYEVEKIAAGPPVRGLGNWSPGQIMQHLAVSMNFSIDGNPLRLPWYLRLMGKIFKGRVLNKPMPAGFNLSKEATALLIPAPTSWEQGLANVRQALNRQMSESKRSPSPFLGELTNEEWTKLHCRHAGLHLSFLVPAAS